MTTIPVTRAAVRKLAAALSKIDTTKLKHTDRLGLIAEAFGWKADGFMHALKTVEDAVPLQRGPKGSWGSSSTFPLDDLGISELSHWKDAASNQKGVLITAGPTGSGKTTVMTATADFLHQQGRAVYLASDLTSTRSAGGSPVLVYGEIRDVATAKEAFDYAEGGYLVLATIHAKSVLEAISHLQHLGVTGDRLELLLALLPQRLLREKAKVDGGRRGQILVSALQIFHHRQLVRDYHLTAGGDLVEVDFVEDALRLVLEERVDLDEVGRVLGSDIAQRVERAASFGFKHVFAGSNLADAMRRLNDKVSSNGQVDAQVDLPVDDLETAKVAGDAGRLAAVGKKVRQT